MKKLLLILSFAYAMFVLGCIRKDEPAGQAVNPLIGDISYTSRFGIASGPETEEALRISTHLDYVERLLRAKSTAGLTADLRAKRSHVLNLLREYRMAGVFPRNYDHADRRVPCFIDRDGRICAVGYLVGQTAGREVAEAINTTHQYDELLAMNDKIVDAWVSGNGLTMEEAAMIQPSYGHYPPATSEIKPAYGISSAVFSGINVSVTAINGVQMLQSRGSKAVPIVGLITGAGQIVSGALHYPTYEESLIGYSTDFDGVRKLSMINIGLGTATMLMSAWNLIDRRAVERRTSWNISGFPTVANRSGLALSMTHKF